MDEFGGCHGRNRGPPAGAGGKRPRYHSRRQRGVSIARSKPVGSCRSRRRRSDRGRPSASATPIATPASRTCAPTDLSQESSGTTVGAGVGRRPVPRSGTDPDASVATESSARPPAAASALPQARARPCGSPPRTFVHAVAGGTTAMPTKTQWELTSAKRASRSASPRIRRQSAIAKPACGRLSLPLTLAKASCFQRVMRCSMRACRRRRRRSDRRLPPIHAKRLRSRPDRAIIPRPEPASPTSTP